MGHNRWINREEMAQVFDASIQGQPSCSAICPSCLYKSGEQPYLSKCPHCGSELSMMGELDGACMILSCSQCDYKVIEAISFPPCMQDDCDYLISVTNIEKEKKIKVAKIFGMNTSTLLKILAEEKKVQITVKLNEAKVFLERLDELTVECEVQPSLAEKYPELSHCKYWFAASD